MLNDINTVEKYQYIQLKLFLCSAGGQTSAVGRTLRPRARMAAVRAEVTEAGTMASSWGRATCPPTGPRTCRRHPFTMAALRRLF